MKEVLLLFLYVAGILFDDSYRTVVFKVDESREAKDSCIYEGSAAYNVKVNGQLKQTVRKYKIGTAAGCVTKVGSQISCNIVKVIKEVEFDSAKNESYLSASGVCK